MAKFIFSENMPAPDKDGVIRIKLQPAEKTESDDGSVKWPEDLPKEWHFAIRQLPPHS